MRIQTSIYRMTLLILLALMPVLSWAETQRPVIGISVYFSGDDYNGRLSLGSQYVDAITSAGGLPMMLVPVDDPAMIKQYAEICDGFVFCGGPDISPLRYGADEISTTVKVLNPRRENFDIAMINAVLETDKPLLGVCLGSQELNVALGGSLIQDIPSETTSTINHKPGGSDFAHAIQVTTGTRLQDILGTTTLQVNSIHHQALDRLGSGVKVMARAPDGIVESFEVEGKPFVMAVQWHPEALTEYPAQLAIYKALVDAARGEE